MDCPNCGLINPETAQRCDCGYDFLSKAIKEPYSKEQIDPALNGIRGWLLLFWYTLIFGTPLALLANLLAGSTDEFEVIFCLAFCAFCIYVGISLRRVWPSALKLVKLYLVVAFILGSSTMITYMAGLYKPAHLLRPGTFPGIQAVLYAVIWWFYFKKSKRVKATFSRNL